LKIKAANSTIKNLWKDHFLAALTEEKMVFKFCQNYFSIIFFAEYKVAINLVDMQNSFIPQELIALKASEKNNGVEVINLWEDVWLTKPKQVIFRLKSLLGLNNTIHGRKTTLQKIDKPAADKFLNKNHLQGTVTSRFKFGLFYLDELVAVATFSALRKMNHSDNYKSIELIRFAASGGFSITGGLSKVISHLKILLNPADIMTYADCDWSSGKAYTKLGFEQVANLKPQYFYLDEDLNRKLIKEDLAENEDAVFNTGSLKFILKF